MVSNRTIQFTVVLFLLIQFSYAEERTQFKSAGNAWYVGQKCEVTVPCHQCNAVNTVRKSDLLSLCE